MSVSKLPTRAHITDPELQARVDLAAAHRLAVMHGFHEGIFNHLTLAVPGREDECYYQIPFGMHWSEVTANSFMEVSYDGELISGEGEIERSCYCIHAPIHRLNANARCVMHTHMPYTSALTRLKDPSIKPIGQTELAISMQTVVDPLYTGPAFDPAEGERLASVLGDKTIMLMANHGALTVGKTVADAYDRLYYLERVAQVQIYAMWTGQELATLPQATIDASIKAFKTGPSYGDKSIAEHHFDALKRLLDREGSDYQSN